MDNVLLIGASGFIGSEVVRQLSLTDARIRMLIHKSQPEIQNNRIELLHGGLHTFDWKLLEDDPPGTIIHTARISGKNRLTRFWAGTRGYSANKRLLNRAYRTDKPPHIVYTSGSLVYGDRGKSPAFEGTVVRPISFQRSYMKAELPFLEPSGQPGNNISVVRPAWVYGPDSWFGQFYYRMMERDGIVPQYGEGDNYMSLLSLHDCARLIIEVARHSDGGSVYNLSVGESMRQREFCDILSRLSGKPVHVLPYRWIRAKYGRDIAEALTFSLIVRSVHPLITGFNSTFKDHSDGLRDTILRSCN